ncbi:ankyrin repeat-containing domain protein [Chaetomium strumarium]|uniref:Ankyrin repeat-containing domain protein n=1 Tax=Chaetomium strumarium TaxID=1170767 RepID=A0AAJ0GPQ9_9PEZI|nr:ankyrin repeat-containing domain protein [Chaetomium strumarium]
MARILELFLDNYGEDLNETHGLFGYTAGWTLLHEAADWRSADAVDVFLKRGAEPNRFTAKGTQHHYTCRDFIFKTGGTWSDGYKDNTCSLSPLCLAIMGGHAGIVENLLAHGVNPDLPCRQCCGCRPIHIAAAYDREDIVRLLVEKYGVDPGTEDPSGRTALHRAVALGRVRLVDMFRNTWRLDPNHTSKDGHTHLHDLVTYRRFLDVNTGKRSWRAVLRERPYQPAVRDKVGAIYKLLRQAGVDVGRRNSVGETPKDCLTRWPVARCSSPLYCAVKEGLEAMEANCVLREEVERGGSSSSSSSH